MPLLKKKQHLAEFEPFCVQEEIVVRMNKKAAQICLQLKDVPRPTMAQQRFQERGIHPTGAAETPDVTDVPIHRRMKPLVVSMQKVFGEKWNVLHALSQRRDRDRLQAFEKREERARDTALPVEHSRNKPKRENGPGDKRTRLFGTQSDDLLRLKHVNKLVLKKGGQMIDVFENHC